MNFYKVFFIENGYSLSCWCKDLAFFHQIMTKDEAKKYLTIKKQLLSQFPHNSDFQDTENGFKYMNNGRLEVRFCMIKASLWEVIKCKIFKYHFPITGEQIYDPAYGQKHYPDEWISSNK